MPSAGAIARNRACIYLESIQALRGGRELEEGEGKYDGKDRQECYIEIRSVL